MTAQTILSNRITKGYKHKIALAKRLQILPAQITSKDLLIDRLLTGKLIGCSLAAVKAEFCSGKNPLFDLDDFTNLIITWQQLRMIDLYNADIEGKPGQHAAVIRATTKLLDPWKERGIHVEFSN